MINGRVIRSLRARTACGAFAFAIAGLAHAVTSPTLVGGGSTLPALAYVGSAAQTALQIDPVPAATGSVKDLLGLATVSGFPISYCQTGDDAAKNVLVGITGFSVQNNCVKDSAGTVHGLGAAIAGRTDLTQPAFIATEVPLSAGDYTNYVNNHPSGYYPVQFPVLAGAVAIAFNLIDDQGTSVTVVNFTDDQLCNIFSGADDNWSDADLSTAFTLPPGHTVNQPINVVYRSDGSGTTFSFSNHLTHACTGSTVAHFVANQYFTTVVGLYEPTIPGNWVSESGDQAVANGIQTTSASVGYVETANALATGPAVSIAEVNGLSPVTNFGNPLTVGASDLSFNSVLNGVNTNSGISAVGAISSLGLNAPGTQCIALVPPADYATPGNMVPTGSYPIVAISYLLANAQGNGADLSATRGLLEYPYVPQFINRVNTIGPGTGYARLTLGSGTYDINQVMSCIVN